MHTAVDGFLRSLRIERNASPLTLKSYAEDFNSFFDYLQDRVGRSPTPPEVDITMLRGYVAYLHECQYAKTTIARRLASLRSFFRYCSREKLTTSNPAKALRTPRIGRKLPNFLTTQQTVQLIETPSTDEPAGMRDKAMIETMYSAGLRVAELVGMNLSDWDQDANILRVRGKGRKERIAPLGSYATAALHKWLKV